MLGPSSFKIHGFENAGTNTPETLLIDYEKPADGDIATVEQVHLDDAYQTVTIGVCDPKTVVDKNLEKRNAKVQDWTPNYHIVAVMIDRISLALLARKPSRIVAYMNDDQKKREKALTKMIARFRSGSLGAPSELGKHTRNVEIDYWSAGQTTKLISQRYLKLEQSPVDGTLTASMDIDRLRQREIDVAITHAPWELDAIELTELEVFSRQCFPAIQFPFSCLVAPALPATADNKQLAAVHWVIEQFVEALYLGVTLVNRNPIEAADILLKYRERFRNYGINEYTQVHAKATSAISHFLVNGCYSDGLWPEWTAWEYALGLDPSWKPPGDYGSWWRTAQDVLAKSMNRGYCKHLQSTPQDVELLLKQYDLLLSASKP